MTMNNLPDPNFQPQSEGDRMYAAFRTAGDRRHTALAVTGPDGLPLNATVQDYLGEMVLLLRQIALGISLLTDELLVEEDATEE